MRRSAVVVVVAALVAVSGCKKKVDSGDDRPRPASGTATPAGPPALEILVHYGSEKKTWLDEQIGLFNATSAKLPDGRIIKVIGKAMGSGEAVQGIVTGTARPHVFSPASGAYVTLLNQAWLSTGGHTRALAPAGEPVVLSPLVIAMWRPMAEALGWPAKALGWRDIIAVSKDPGGWASHGRPEWGLFKLGHTHPGYSNSGLLAVLAEAYAGADKTRGLTVADLDATATQGFVAEIEEAIVHYGKSTGFFADKMLERGPTYLSAAVLYENLVIESYAKQPAIPVVAIYPVEGTFWSDHPYAILDAEWVGPDERAGAQAFLAFLKARPAQERALALGFRPADPAIAIGAPIDLAHGVDPQQPQTLLEVPDGATLDHLLTTWSKVKKTSTVVMVFDKSGSMDGKALEQAKAGARAFLGILDDRDQVAMVFFDDKVYPRIGPLPLGTGRAELDTRIAGTIASGGTALYDAIGVAWDELAVTARKSPHRIHALVVMTDGQDTDSKTQLADLSRRLGAESTPIRVFTIGYGDQAEGAVLKGIADAARGSHTDGNVDTIIDIYRDMATFF